MTTNWMKGKELLGGDPPFTLFEHLEEASCVVTDEGDIVRFDTDEMNIHRPNDEPTYKVRWSVVHVGNKKYQLQHEKKRLIKILLDSNFSFDTVKAPEKKLRPSQRHRKACREVAARIWKKEEAEGKPITTIADMILRDELTTACEGKIYVEKTMKRWIRDLCPDRTPGRRKKTK
jgi:hypothetical protein